MTCNPNACCGNCPNYRPIIAIGEQDWGYCVAITSGLTTTQVFNCERGAVRADFVCPAHPDFEVE